MSVNISWSLIDKKGEIGSYQRSERKCYFKRKKLLSTLEPSCAPFEEPKILGVHVYLNAGYL